MRKPLLVGLVCIGTLFFVGQAAAQSMSMWDSARSRGIKLPKRIGIGVSYYDQKQGYDIDSLDLGLFSWDPTWAEGLGVNNETTSIHATFDYWLFPFLNVELLVGNIDGTTRVQTSGLDIGIPLGDITVKYDGLMYGAGFTLAGGWDYYFVSLTTQYTNTDLDVSDSTAEAWVVTPKLGVRSGRGALWVGAMYQKVEERHMGIFEDPTLAQVLGTGQIPFDVTLGESKPWNYLAGISVEMSENWVITGEWGFGDRDSMMAYLAYRF